MGALLLGWWKKFLPGTGLLFLLLTLLGKSYLCFGGLGQIPILASCDSEGSWNTLGVSDLLQGP